MPYAVIDLETTGFSPKRGDRILEVGVVLVDDAGEIEGEWGSLVNPQRDVGPTHVHGVRARDVVDAPLFADVADPLADMLGGRALVAHNQAFDVRFLRAELAAHGHALDDDYQALCTMLWSKRTFGAAKLADVCSLLGIEMGTAHAALDDARATSGVLAALMGRVRGVSEWDQHVARAIIRQSSAARRGMSAPVTRSRPDTEPPPAVADTAESPLWQRVTAPISSTDSDGAVYLELVAKVLEDGVISIDEHSRLDSIADIVEVGERRRRRLHAAYLAAAVDEAVADGQVTQSERRELEQIAAVLDLEVPSLPSSAETSDPISVPSVARSSAAVDAPETGATFVLSPGARVVFTGALSRERAEWAQTIAEAGFTTGSVTKNCAVLVAADPATQSGKAKTAAKHGIPIVTEAEFVRVFEAYVAGIAA